MEGMVHVGLEGGQGVAESKKHNGWFIESKRGGEGRLPTVFQLDEDIVIAPSDVELGEDFAVFEFVHQLRYEG